MDEENQKIKKNRRAVKYIVGIVFILAVSFLSQQSYMGPVGKELVSLTAEKINSYWLKATDWFWTGLYPNVKKETAEKGSVVKDEVITQKDSAAKNVWENIKKYFAGKFSKFSGTKVE